MAMLHVLPADDLALHTGRVGAVATGIGCTPVIRLPAPPWIRPSLLTSMWINSPGRSRS
jgi:hypothetical protein